LPDKVEQELEKAGTVGVYSGGNSPPISYSCRQADDSKSLRSFVPINEKKVTCYLTALLDM
jgi:hypothetical protein